jgi:hypothetical protein
MLSLQVAHTVEAPAACQCHWEQGRHGTVAGVSWQQAAGIPPAVAFIIYLVAPGLVVSGWTL